MALYWLLAGRAYQLCFYMLKQLVGKLSAILSIACWGTHELSKKKIGLPDHHNIKLVYEMVKGNDYKISGSHYIFWLQKRNRR